MSSKISLFLPLPHAWSDIEDLEASAEVVLERPSEDPFEQQILGTTLDDKLKLDTAAHQRRIGTTTDAKLTLILRRKKLTEIETIELSAEGLTIGPIALGRTRKAAVQQEPELDILLQGSLVFELANFSEEGRLNWLNWLKSLWPTGDPSAVTHLRIEPDGLYLQGILPGALFADATDRTDRPVALRVPQLASDFVAKVQDEDADRRHEGRFWSLTSFRFPGLQTDSRAFVQEHAERFRAFRLLTDGGADPSAPRRSDTFIDNLVATPPPECVVRIFSNGDALEWDARPPGVRLVIAAGRSDETTFFPRALTGRAVRDNSGRFARDINRPVQFESGVFDPDPPKLPIRLEASNRGGAGQVDFQFPAETLVALSVPIVPPSPPGGPPPLPEQAGDLDPDAPREPVRNWICTRDGWLQLDAERPVSPPTPGLPERDVSGVLPLDTLSGALLRALDPKAGDEAAAGFEVRSEALAAGHIAIALDLADGAESLRLDLRGARTTVLTPRVWFAPRTGPGPDTPREAVPSLTAAALSEATRADDLDLDQESDEQRKARAKRLQERLDEVLQPATFVTFVPRAPGTIGELDAQHARRLYAEISWDAAKRQFRFAFPADRLVAWQRPSLPLVTNYPLTPPSDRDAYLDSNRGLIPFVRKEPNDGSRLLIDVGFPAGALPRLLSEGDVRPPDFPRPEDDGWRPARETRVFLPTLPGLEADVTAGPTDWAYRHAVPALDEAYAEAREGDDGPAVVTPIGLDQDLARVEGTVAFTVGAAGTDGASGWLPVGTAPISDVKPEELATANPRLSFQLGGPGSEHRINFDRRSGVAALSANLSYEFTDSSRPAFSALALSPNPAAQARDEAIIHNGQPMLTRWSSVLNAVVTLDGDGLVRAEPTGPDQLAWPPGANEPIVRRTVSLTLLVPRGENMPNGEHILDLVGVSVGRAPEPDDLGLERWTWTEGEEKTWPSLLGFQLYPLQLVSLANDGTVVLRAVLLPRPPEKSADPLHAPSFAKGSLLLTFKPTDQLNKLELAEVAGDMDWRFPTPLSAPESEPRVERLVARVSLDAGGDSLTLAIREVAVRHEVGLLRLVPGVSASQEASIVVDPALGPMLQARLKDAVERPSDGARLEYEVELNITPSDAGEDPPQAPIWGEYLFRWSSNLPKMDGTEGPLAWELSNAAPSSVDEGGPPAADPGDPPTRWQLRFLRSTQDLVGVLGVEPHRISARDMLFQVKALRPSPDVDDKSWFQTTPLHRGFAAVTFTPSGGPATVPLPAVFAAEIPLSFVGQTADRTIQVYDPSDDTLHTWDRGTESITLGRDGLPLKRDGLPLKEEAIRFANASLVGTSQDEIVFARSGEPGQLVSISLPRNVTTSKPFAAGVTTRALTVMRLNQRNIAVAVDDAEDVRAWDLTDNSPPRPTGPGPTIEKPLGKNVAGSHVSAIGWAPDGDVNVVAWARKSADGSDAWVYVWDRQNNRQAQDVGTGPADTLRRINPHIEGLSPETAPPKWPQSKASPITAITVSNNGELLISGAQDGSLLVWKHDVKPTELPVVLQKMIHLPPSSPITALTSLIFGDDRIISADEAGMLRVWPNPQNTNPTPPLDQIPTVVAENEIPHGAAVAALVPLGLDGKRTQFAVLDRDGTVTLYKVLRGTATSPEDTVFQRERLDTRGASIRSIAALPISDSRIKLLLDGVAAPSRLEGVLRAGTAGLSIEVSGRLTAQDAIDYEDLSVSGARCTHRADLVFNRARVPLESLFRGAGPPQPLSLGAMVEHTFRFPLGPERVWQTPQVVRLMRAEDFANAYAVNHPGGDDLVIDAGAVHWLQWVDKADREPGGAASVSNESLRILLRPREVGRMQRGAPRVVRLPTVLQRAPLDPPMGLVLKVPAASEASLGALTLAAETSGAQPLQPPPDSLTIGIVDPPLDPRAAQDDSVSYFDRGAEAAWLDERFLHGLLIPRRSPAPGLPQPPTGPVSPILNNDDVILDSSGELGDLAWLRLTKRPSHLPEGAEDLRSLGPISLRRLQPQLAAATVANKHRPGGPESAAIARLDGPTLAEFPFVVEASGAGASGTSSPFQDVQLVVFEGGRFRRLDRVQLPTSSDPLAWKSDALDWASNQRAARGRRDALFLFINSTELLILPRSFRSTREDLRAAWPWELENGGDAGANGIDAGRIPEARCVPPGAIGAGLTGDPTLSLTVFGARPVGPHPVDRPVKGVAATRFRLAPTLANGIPGAGRLRAAQVDESHSFAYSALDEVRFDVQLRPKRPYPRADPGALTRRPDPAIAPDPAVEPESPTAWLLPPLLDVVAWAARPGEQTSTTWSLRRLGAAVGPAVRTSLRRPRAMPGAEEAVRLQALGRPVLAGGGRFCEQAFRLTQVIERTSFLPDNADGGVYAVLTTRSELFRSSPDQRIASTRPARVYDDEPFELTLIAKASGGLPDIQMAESPDGTGPVPVAIPYLLFLDASVQPNDVQDRHKREIKAPPSDGWEKLGDGDVFLMKIPVPKDLSTDFEVMIRMFTRPQPLPQPVPELLPDKDVWACLKVNRLKPQTRFRAPKMSLALLAKSKGSAPSTGFYRLSGYGRLGDSGFTPISPGLPISPEPGNNAEDVEWSRRAGLWTLDRVAERKETDNPEDPFDYDVVVYGPGGELIPTIDSSP